MDSERKQALTEQAAPFLNKGEIITHIVLARRGDNSWLGAWKALLLEPRVLVVSDNAILVLAADRSGRPREILARLPRRTKLGTPLAPTANLGLTPLDGCRWFEVKGELLWVSVPDAAEVKAIDDEWAYKTQRRAVASD